ncbi:hypothetical protein niasHS_010633 [Heterodera schachtii]|uniref:Homeobox domain-containing protein n=2 Tax=Heterodera TaxID=34509 RepID=A0ABD2IUB0_HETSC
MGGIRLQQSSKDQQQNIPGIVTFRFLFNRMLPCSVSVRPPPSSAPSPSFDQFGISPPPPAHFSFFSDDQVTFVCQCLENCANFSALLFFVESIERHCGGSLAMHPSRDILHRAKALSLFHCRQFGEMYAFIRRSQFAHDDHRFLQKLWHEAHYAEIEQMRGKRPDAVARYRIRKRNGPPLNIWDGESMSYCFKKTTRQILRESFRRQNTPSQEEKVRLARRTELSTAQVTNWFKNQRQRARQRGEKQKNEQKQQKQWEGSVNYGRTFKVIGIYHLQKHLLISRKRQRNGRLAIWLSASPTKRQ